MIHFKNFKCLATPIMLAGDIVAGIVTSIIFLEIPKNTLEKENLSETAFLKKATAHPPGLIWPHAFIYVGLETIKRTIYLQSEP